MKKYLLLLSLFLCVSSPSFSGNPDEEREDAKIFVKLFRNTTRQDLQRIQDESAYEDAKGKKAFYTLVGSGLSLLALQAIDVCTHIYMGEIKFVLFQNTSEYYYWRVATQTPTRLVFAGSLAFLSDVLPDFLTGPKKAACGEILARSGLKDTPHNQGLLKKVMAEQQRRGFGTPLKKEELLAAGELTETPGN